MVITMILRLTPADAITMQDEEGETDKFIRVNSEKIITYKRIRNVTVIYCHGLQMAVSVTETPNTIDGLVLGGTSIRSKKK